MKVVILLSLAFAGCAKAIFEGASTEEIFDIIASGSGQTYEDLFPEDNVPNLRKLQAPKASGESCSRSEPCAEGLDCVRYGWRRQCAPVTCIKGAIQDYIKRNDMEDFHHQVMAAAGYPTFGRDAVNTTVARMGLSALKGGASILRDDFRQSITDEMTARQPDLDALLYDVLEACPEAATKEGVTIFLGLNYELSLGVKYYQNFVFGIGTGDVELDLGNGDDDASNSSSIPSFDFNVSAAVYTECCGGAGLDVGFDFSLTFGLFLSGVADDYLGCGWMCDIDAGVGSLTGFSAGCTNGIGKFFFSQGVGAGVSLGISGCGTMQIADLSI